MQGNPAENQAANGQHLNKPICHWKAFECRSPAALRCGNCFKSPKMTTTTPFSKPQEVFTSFLHTFLLGSRSVSRTMLPFGWWLLKGLPVATSPEEIPSTALQNFKAWGGNVLWPANYKPIRSVSFWLTEKRRLEIGRVSLSLSSWANILTCFSIQTGAN